MTLLLDGWPKRAACSHLTHDATPTCQNPVDLGQLGSDKSALADERRQAASPIEATQLELAPVGELEP